MSDSFQIISSESFEILQEEEGNYSETDLQNILEIDNNYFAIK